MAEGITNEKLFRVLDVVSGSSRVSQRDLATSTGFSLGLVNLILKRLALTGHIKIANLSKRKMEYILTPKGAMEKTRRTSSYVVSTVRTYREYERRLRDLVRRLLAQGHRDFALLGDGEISALVRIALSAEAPRARLRVLRAGQKPREGETVLDCRHDGLPGALGISILGRLLERTPATYAH